MRYKIKYVILVFFVFIINSSFLCEEVSGTSIDNSLNVVEKTINIININEELVDDSEKIDIDDLTFLINDKKNKETNNDCIIVANGDLYLENKAMQIIDENSFFEFANKIELSAVAMNNKAFGWSREKIEYIEKYGQFEFLAANIVNNENKSEVDWIKPYKIIESNGIKIGLIGVVTEEMLYKELAKEINSIDVISPEIAINKYARELKTEQNVNAVVVISNLNVKRDNVTNKLIGTAVDLAKNTYNVDAIIADCGKEGIVDFVNNIPIISEKCNSKEITGITLSFNKDGVLLKAEGKVESSTVSDKNSEEKNKLDQYKKMLDYLTKRRITLY